MGNIAPSFTEWIQQESILNPGSVALVILRKRSVCQIGSPT